MVELKDLLPFTKKLKLLCVDGDSAVRQSLVKTFERIFDQVDDAANGYDGLNHYKINQHDLIITETNLEHYSAIAMIEQIKKINPSQHVIVISTSQDAQSILTWTNIGVYGYISKPISMQGLLNSIYRSCSQLYSSAQKAQKVDASKQIKEQKQQLQEHYEANEKKLNEALSYERKRLGRLMGNERELQNRILEQEKMLESVRFKDDLTGFSNKYALKTDLDKDGNKALLFLDIDNFESINTLYGMGYGNRVLKETAVRLERFLPSSAKLYRITADEFVILIFEPTVNQELLLSQQILSNFQESPLIIGDVEFDISFSMGMDKGEHNKLFVNAKTASAEAKEKGHSQMVVFHNNSEYVKRQRDSLYWIQTVKEALKNDRVISYYQPVYNNETGNVDKYGVLSRILNKDGSVVVENTSIHPAHLAGLTPKITKVIIDKAFKYFESNEYPFSINISAEDLNENYLEEFLQYKCDYYHILPQRVYLEVVESITTSVTKESLEQIKRLRSKGFNIMIDDFGIEQSVFSRLIRLEAKTIKIDKSFIKNIDTNLSNQMIVENIVSFASRIGVQTVAESVDTKSVHEKVCELGINFSQGKYIGEPSDTIKQTQHVANNIAI